MFARCHWTSFNVSVDKDCASLDFGEWHDLAEVHEPYYVALKTLFAGVRRAGSWKLWTLEDVKALLRLPASSGSGCQGGTTVASYPFLVSLEATGFSTV